MDCSLSIRLTFEIISYKSVKLRYHGVHNCDSIRMLIFNHEQVLMSALETHKIEIAIVPLRGPLGKTVIITLL